MPAQVVSLASRRVIDDAGMLDLDKQDAIARLRRRITRGTIVYAVPRYYDAANEWIICDFYLIDGHSVAGITDDVARALDRFDQARDVGVKFARRPGRDVLRELIDGTLSRLLFGAADVIRHQVIR